jgi:hypothetical protein
MPWSVEVRRVGGADDPERTGGAGMSPRRGCQHVCLERAAVDDEAVVPDGERPGDRDARALDHDRDLVATFEGEGGIPDRRGDLDGREDPIPRHDHGLHHRRVGLELGRHRCDLGLGAQLGPGERLEHAEQVLVGGDLRVAPRIGPIDDHVSSQCEPLDGRIGTGRFHGGIMDAYAVLRRRVYGLRVTGHRTCVTGHRSPLSVPVGVPSTKYGVRRRAAPPTDSPSRLRRPWPP